jgi:beta-lactamase class A
VRDVMVFQRARGLFGRRLRAGCLSPARGRRKSHIAAALVTLTVSCAGCAQSAGSAQRLMAVPAARVVVLKKTGVKAVKAAQAKSPQQLLSAAVAPLVASDGGHVSVAVDDLSTGRAASYGGTEEYDTASIVKVDILSTLLYQAQQEGRQLSATEQELATTMIENSDNGAASELYDDDGGAAAIDAANQAFGLTETTVGTDGVWGLTTTTVGDQVRLLRTVFATPSALSPDSQGYVQGLMGQVEPDQQWGVPAAADSGTPFAVKDGWLPNPALWEINSIGEITHDGQNMLIAVLSSDNETEDGGISLVQDIAVRAADALAKAW